jgi:uncharacterized protein YggE
VKDTQDRSRISVAGEATVVRKADMAILTVFISTDRALLEDAVNEGATKAAEVRRALRDAYDEINDIQIRDIHVGQGFAPSFGRDKNNPPRPEVVKSVTILIPPKPDLAVKIVDSASRAGCLLGKPAGFGALSDPNNAILYALSDPADAEQEATTRAIADAREKASRTAKMFEKRIGSVMNVVEDSLSLGSPSQMLKPRNLMRPSPKYVSVSADGVAVSRRITVAFELLD